MKNIGIYGLFVILLFANLIGKAQSPSPKRSYDLIRYNDDFSFLRQGSIQKEFFDPIKFIPLTRKKSTSLSLGAELRHQYQVYRNPQGQGTIDKNGHFLQRYMFHLDNHFGRYFRVFVQANSGISSGRNPGPRPRIDQNLLEINQLFTEFRLPIGAENDGFRLRIGRMEQKLGTARLISPREGQNIRRSFEGVQLAYEKGNRKLVGFALREVLSNPAVFDDRRDQLKLVAGLLLQVKPKKGYGYTPYIFAKHDEDEHKFGFRGKSWRIIPGIRIFKKMKSGFSWNVETAAQWHQLESRRSISGLIAAGLKYSFTSHKYQPNIGVSAIYSSGAKDSSLTGMGTFDALFPKPVIGQSFPLSPSNIFIIHSEFRIHPKQRLAISLHIDQLFRSNRADVIYNPGGISVVQIPVNGSNSLFIGNQTRIELKMKTALHYFLTLEYAVLVPGNFLKDANWNSALQYASIKSVYRL